MHLETSFVGSQFFLYFRAKLISLRFKIVCAVSSFSGMEVSRKHSRTTRCSYYGNVYLSHKIWQSLTGIDNKETNNCYNWLFWELWITTCCSNLANMYPSFSLAFLGGFDLFIIAWIIAPKRRAWSFLVAFLWMRFGNSKSSPNHTSAWMM